MLLEPFQRQHVSEVNDVRIKQRAFGINLTHKDKKADTQGSHAKIACIVSKSV